MNIFSLLSDYTNTLSTLKTTWDNVVESGNQAIILLEASSGMKKTNLIRKFIEESNATFIRTRGTNVPSPFLPFHSAFESIFNLDEIQKYAKLTSPIQGSVKHQRLIKALISSTPLLNSITVPDWVDSHQWQTAYQPTLEREIFSEDEDFTIFPRPITLPNRLVAVLSELAIISPMIFFLDDIDLMDISTLDALTRELLPTLQTVPILFILTFDSDTLEQNQQFSTLIESLKSNFPVINLSIHPLNDEVIKQIIRIENSTWENPVIEKIIHYSAGNLSQLQDLLKWIQFQYDNKIRFDPNNIPSHESLFNIQFSHLAPIEQDILKVASCQGRYFCAEVIGEILQKPINEIFESLNQISSQEEWIGEDTNLVLEGKNIHWFRFRGRRYFELVYKMVPETLKRSYHFQVGLAFEKVYGESINNIAGILVNQFDQSDEKVKAAKYYSILANQANHQGDSISAYEYSEKGLNYIDKNNQRLLCLLYAEKGKALQLSGKAYIAIDILKLARKIALELSLENNIIIDIDYHLGLALLNNNQWESGVETIFNAIDQALKFGNWFHIAEIFEAIRVAFYIKGDQAFIKRCDLAIDIIRNHKTPIAYVTIAEIFEDKGWFFQERREIELAIQSYEEGFSILSELKKPSNYPEIFYKLHRQMAETLRLKGEISLAGDTAEKAKMWASACYRRDFEAQACITKALCLDSIGDYKGAELEFTHAKKILLGHPDLNTLARVAENYGLFLSNTGNKLAALEQYELEYKYSLQANNYRQTQIAQNDIAAIYKHLGKFPEALATFQQLLNEGIAQQDIARQVVSLNHIGDIMCSQGKLIESEKFHLQAIQLCDQMSKLSSKLISLRYLLGNYLVAFKYSEANKLLTSINDLKIKQVGTNRDYFRCQVYEYRLLGNNFQLHDAIEGLKDAADNLESSKDLFWAGLARINLGLCYLLLDNPSEAVTHSKIALSLLQSTQSWKVSDAYHLLSRCHLALYNFDEAKTEIAKAKFLYMKFQLFHRVTQSELTETAIDISQEKADLQQWRKFVPSEMEQTFKFVGI